LRLYLALKRHFEVSFVGDFVGFFLVVVQGHRLQVDRAKEVAAPQNGGLWKLMASEVDEWVRAGKAGAGRTGGK